MASLFIEAEPRTESGKGPNRRLRAAGRIPAVVYGDNKETISVSLDPKSVVSIIRSHAGVNTIFELGIKGAKGRENVMIKEYQIEPVEHHLLHADLVRVAMDKELTLNVPVELTGIAVGVKQEGGMLEFITRSVEISVLPRDLPETIVADVTELALGRYLRAGDLQLPPGVKLVSDTNLVIAHVVAPKAEEEKPAEAAPAEGAEAAAAKAETPAEGKSGGGEA